MYKGKYYLTDKSGARLADEATEIYNRLDENGLPVYDEGKPIKVGSKTEYKWDFNVNVIDREDITVFGKWTTNTYSITLKISEADKANGAKFAKTNETELFIGGVNFGATDKAIAQLISNKSAKRPTAVARLKNLLRRSQAGIIPTTWATKSKSLTKTATASTRSTLQKISILSQNSTQSLTNSS